MSTATSTNPGPSAPPATDEARSVLGRGVAILASFSRPRSDRLTITEIARRTALPLASTSRLCTQLAHEGLLERDTAGLYLLGARLRSLASASDGPPPTRNAPAEPDLAVVARPYLERIHDLTGAAAQLVELAGSTAAVLARWPAVDPRWVIDGEHTVLPLHATSGGIALLAFAGSRIALLDALSTSTLPRYTAQTISAEHDLRRAVALARQRGFAECRGQLRPDSISVAVPVMVTPSRARAAISVVSTDPMDVRRSAALLKSAADAIASAARRRAPAREAL